MVAEEITGAIVSRPYGGFPWLPLAPLLFDSFENSHNGYGAIDELRTATTDQAQAFFERYYAPGNAILCLAGDVSADRGLALAERYFSDIPARPVPVRPVVAEPDLTTGRRDSYVDPLAPLPAFASAWRVPDPVTDLRGHLAYLVLCLLLTDSALGRLTRRLARRDRSVSSVDCGIGLTGEVFGVRDPTCLVLTASPVPGGPGTDAILEAVDEEIERLAAEGPDPAELTAATRTISAQLVRLLDGLAGRARLLAVFALQHGDAHVVNELGPLSRAVTAADVRAAAAMLRPERRATVELHPGAAR